MTRVYKSSWEFIKEIEDSEPPYQSLSLDDFDELGDRHFIVDPVRMRDFAKAFSKNRTIRSFYFTSGLRNYSYSQFEWLLKAIAGNRSLTSLKFKETNNRYYWTNYFDEIDVNIFKMLMNMIANHPTIKKLDFSGVTLRWLGSEKFNLFLNAIAANEGLDSFNFSSALFYSWGQPAINLRTKQFKSLLDILSKKRITVLDLSSNCF